MEETLPLSKGVLTDGIYQISPQPSYGGSGYSGSWRWVCCLRLIWRPYLNFEQLQDAKNKENSND